MQRIAVIGCSGAGKSALSFQLADLLDLPLHHLDKLFWLPDWKVRDPAEFRELHDNITRESRWIIDGNNGSTMESRLAACDTVIYLDFPTRIFLWRVLRRSLGKKVRPDMAEGCHERIDLEFCRYVLTFRRKHGPRIEQLLARLSHCSIHRLVSPKDVRSLLSTLPP